MKLWEAPLPSSDADVAEEEEQGGEGDDLAEETDVVYEVVQTAKDLGAEILF